MSIKKVQFNDDEPLNLGRRFSIALSKRVVQDVTVDVCLWLFYLQYHVPATRWQTVKALAQNSIVLSSLTLSLTGNILSHIKDSPKRNCARCATVDCEHFMPSSQKIYISSKYDFLNPFYFNTSCVVCHCLSVEHPKIFPWKLSSSHVPTL